MQNQIRRQQIQELTQPPQGQQRQSQSDQTRKEEQTQEQAQQLWGTSRQCHVRVQVPQQQQFRPHLNPSQDPNQSAAPKERTEITTIKGLWRPRSVDAALVVADGAAKTRQAQTGAVLAIEEAHAVEVKLTSSTKTHAVKEEVAAFDEEPGVVKEEALPERRQPLSTRR
ncbi:hypothetical protein M758_UG193000 [Ceratodon purpureus]|nr:hypothetical protein M758_UG193000 [Ceratodon purpureus]